MKLKKNVKKALLFTTLLLGGILTITATGKVYKPAPKNARIEGTISEIKLQEDNYNNAAILVQGDITNTSNYDLGYCFITKDTEISYKEGNKAYLSNLVEGIKVEVVYGNEVQESYPVQGEAVSVTIVRP